MGKRILLADDSVTIHKVVELTFLDEDYQVEAVSNGDEAIARLAGEAPDLVIADVHMPPGPSGYEVVDKVREMHPGVPVLLLAGAFEAFDEERAAAADAYLKKPFDSQRLLQTVQELMEDEERDASMPAGEPAGGELAEPPAEEAEPVEVEPIDAMEPDPVEPIDEIAAGLAPPPGEPATDPAGEGQAATGEVGPAAGGGSPFPVTDEPGAPAAGLSQADVDAIARRVVELMGDEVVREVAWEVVPDLAEVVVKDRLRELEEPGE